VDVDVLLVGGGVASARCARALRRRGFGGSILLVGDEPLPPYNRPPLSKEFLRGAPAELLAAEPPGWYERHAVDLLTDATVVRLDPDERRARLSDGRSVQFDRCLLATGAAARPLPVPGGDGALLLRTLKDAHRIRDAAAAAGPGAPVLIIGGGLIGVEIASGLAVLGLRPTIVELAGALWGGNLGELLPSWARERLSGVGVTVLLGSTVMALDEEGGWLEERRVPAAFVVAGVGVRPRDELAAAAGLAVDRGISVGPDQRTSHAAVWAAGDATRMYGRVTEHWHAARESGERAALSMMGIDVGAPRAPWVFTEVAGTSVDIFGAGDAVDHEEWIAEGRAIARTRDDRLEQLVVIGSAVPAEKARGLVEAKSGMPELREALTSLPA